MIEKLGGRKYTLAVLILVSGAVYGIVTKVPFSQFVDLVKWVLGLFIAGNVGAYLTTELKK